MNNFTEAVKSGDLLLVCSCSERYGDGARVVEVNSKRVLE